MIEIMVPAIQNYLRDVPARPIVLTPGEYLFHLGDPVVAIHIVEAGAIHLSRYQSDGSVLVLQNAGPGTIVAEASMYSETYHCDATASGPTRLRAFSKAGLLRDLRGDPDFADVWARNLAHELRAARLRAEILSIKTVEKRLDARIAWHGDHATKRGIRKTIANEIGVSPEALYRELARRRRQSNSRRGNFLHEHV